MKALTLWEPYASLVALGHKTVETRSWAAPRDLIGGRIAIHAAKRAMDLRDWPNELLFKISDEAPEMLEQQPHYGCVVATARLAACGQVNYVQKGQAYYVYPSTPGQVAIDVYGDFSRGRYLWILDEIQRLDPPVPARGRQGVWKWDPPAERPRGASVWPTATRAAT